MFEIDPQEIEMSFLEPIMVDNGFTREENKFVNDDCIVEADFEKRVYNIFWQEKRNGARCETSSQSFDLYWLFGFLSANELVNRNFKL